MGTKNIQYQSWNQPASLFLFIIWRHAYGKTLTFSRQKYDFKIILMSYDK